MSVKPTDQKQFEALLRDSQQWPGSYTFKFIVPKEQLETLSEQLPDYDLSWRASSSGRFLSCTAEAQFDSPKDVLAVYAKISKVDRVIML